MHWEQLLSLKRYGDRVKRLRNEQDELRLGFEVDYDRIIFSSAFRSLQDKTQVIPLSGKAFVHTRLTHSLEVSVVGRSLGRLAGRAILKKHPYLEEIHGFKFGDFGAIVAAAALAHDIGNPPFGHSGEKAIGAFFERGEGMSYQSLMTEAQWQDLTKFEGNANGFRILTESRQGVEGGLRLSYATLGAFTKYPKPSLPQIPSGGIATKKYGFFQSEVSVFKDLAEDMQLTAHPSGATNTFVRHPLAFLVEAADDICYTVIDFEDGINLGLIDESYALEYLIKLVQERIDTAKYHSLTTTHDRLGYLRALAIQSLINDAVHVFMEHEEDILMGTFNVSLLKKSRFKAQIDDIISLSVRNIYRCDEVIEKEISGYRILQTLLQVFTGAVVREMQGKEGSYDTLLLSRLPKREEKHSSAYDRLLLVAQFVAGLTDRNALDLYKMVEGHL